MCVRMVLLLLLLVKCTTTATAAVHGVGCGSQVRARAVAVVRSGTIVVRVMEGLPSSSCLQRLRRGLCGRSAVRNVGAVRVDHIVNRLDFDDALGPCAAVWSGCRRGCLRMERRRRGRRAGPVLRGTGIRRRAPVQAVLLIGSIRLVAGNVRAGSPSMDRSVTVLFRV